VVQFQVQALALLIFFSAAWVNGLKTRVSYSTGCRMLLFRYKEIQLRYFWLDRPRHGVEGKRRGRSGESEWESCAVFDETGSQDAVFDVMRVSGRLIKSIKIFQWQECSDWVPALSSATN